MKKISKFILISLPIIAVIGIYGIYRHDVNRIASNEQYAKVYWEQCDVSFCGVVTSKKVLHRGFGYICLDKTFSNKKSPYSFFINDEVFVCEISEDNVLYVSEAAQLQVGDSVCYNINDSKSEVRYRNGIEYMNTPNGTIGGTTRRYSPKSYKCN